MLWTASHNLCHTLSMGRRRKNRQPLVAPAGWAELLVRGVADLDRAEGDIARAVGIARANGATWDRIAAVSGINRETLRRNYGDARK